MEQKIILHIPHSSTNIPLMDGFIVDGNFLTREMLKLTDWYTDDLFYSHEDEMIKAEFSRIFCDPERFADDTQEIMSQFGMGVLYEKSDDGKVIRKVRPNLKSRVLNDFYWPHHKKLSEAVNNQLNHFGKALILDCHSFPSKPLKRDLDQSPRRPDFNIGTDYFHTPKYLIDLAKSFFDNAGYTLGINRPYKGSIVPLEYYNRNKNVEAIMLEINRALYLKEPTNEKSEKYLKIKKVTNSFIKTIKNTFYLDPTHF